MKLCFVDTETTGLDAERHEIWEIGMIVREPLEPNTDTNEYLETEYVWQLPVDLTLADPIALNIGRFHDRRWPPVPYDPSKTIPTYPLDQKSVQGILDGNNRDPQYAHQVPDHRMDEWSAHFVELTRNAHLVGNVVSFDEERLRRLLLKHGQMPMWHYHLVDVETLIAGRLALTPPWKSKQLSEAMAIDVPDNQHEALADARWAMDMYEAVMQSPSYAWGDAVKRQFEL